MYILFILSWLLTPSFTTQDSLRTVQRGTPNHPGPEAPSGVLFSSGDGGLTWQNIDMTLPDRINPSGLMTIGDESFLVSYEGVFHSKTSLSTPSWQRTESLPDQITGIFPGAHGPYAVSRLEGLFRYQRNTGKWTKLDNTLKDMEIFSLLETHAGALFAGCGNGIYTSTDEGDNWLKVFDKGPVTKLTEAHDILIGCGQHELWRSDDGGTKWMNVLSDVCTPFQIQWFDEEMVVIFFGHQFAGIAMPNVVYTSSDLGVNWKPLPYALPRALDNISDLKKVGNSFYACGQEGIFRSEDHGANWKLVLSNPDNKGGSYKLVESEKLIFALFMGGC